MFEAIREFLAVHITCYGATTIIAGILLVVTAAMAVAAYHIAKRLLELVEHLVLRSPTD